MQPEILTAERGSTTRPDLTESSRTAGTQCRSAPPDGCQLPPRGRRDGGQFAHTYGSDGSAQFRLGSPAQGHRYPRHQLPGEQGLTMSSSALTLGAFATDWWGGYRVRRAATRTAAPIATRSRVGAASRR